MKQSEETKRRGWRQMLPLGLGIGVGFAVSEEVERATLASLGEWGAFFAALLACGVSAGLVAAVVYLLLNHRKTNAGETT